MSADEQHSTPGRRRRRYPNLILRTMRGGLADPADIPEDPHAEAQYAHIAAWLRARLECDEIRISARLDESGNPRVTAWMPQSAARRLADLTEDSVRMNLLDGDLQRAQEGMQYAEDLRTLTELGRNLDLQPPQSGGEQHN
jgi:hypothetical protein